MLCCSPNRFELLVEIDRDLKNSDSLKVKHCDSPLDSSPYLATETDIYRFNRFFCLVGIKNPGEMCYLKISC